MKRVTMLAAILAIAFVGAVPNALAEGEIFEALFRKNRTDSITFYGCGGGEELEAVCSSVDKEDRMVFHKDHTVSIIYAGEKSQGKWTVRHGSVLVRKNQENTAYGFAEGKYLVTVSEGSGDLIAYKIAAGAANTFWSAIFRGDADSVRQHIGRGADVNEKIAGSARPVFEAIDPKYAASMPRDASNPTWLGYTPIILASQLGYADVVRVLLDNEANPNVRKGNGATPLIMAAQEGHPDVVRLLLDHGADVNATWRNGATALFQAAREGHEEVVRVLLANGADKNARRGDGATPLSVASQRGHRQVVDLLKKNNPD